jgi:hypothetical protein
MAVFSPLFKHTNKKPAMPVLPGPSPSGARLARVVVGHAVVQSARRLLIRRGIIFFA